MTTAEPAAGVTASDPQSLVDALLFSVSHDLRSPLLTLALSTDLIEEALRDQAAAEGESGTVAIALDALRHGAKDLERMLQALTAVSRARRRPLDHGIAPLQLLLGGHIVISEDDLDRRSLAVDVIAVRECIDAVWGDQAVEVHVRVAGDMAVLTFPALTVDCDGSPLEALASSLRVFAGGEVQALAVGQVLIERMGGGVRCAAGRPVFWLPLADLGGQPR